MVESDGGRTDVADRVRVLIPSPLGVLGLEFDEDVVTRLDIVPIGKQRAAYRPFAELRGAARSETVEEAIGRLSEYLAGARRKLEIDYDVGRSGADEFGRRVLRQTARIPYGRTRTYQEIAAAIGQPSAYRQVLAALVVNPLPLVVPCHRVVPNRSGIGSYVAAATKKEWLLKLERRVLAGD